MAETLIRYPTDPTGNNTDNAIAGEAHTLNARSIRVLAPKYGPFFTESFSVTDDATGLALTLGTQYKFAEFLQEPTCKYNKDIAQLVIILDPTVSSNVRVNYQVLGGLYQNDSSPLIEVYEAVLSHERHVDWISVINAIEQHPDSLHQYILQDSHGYEYVVEVLERIRQAILLNDVSALDDEEDWAQSRIAELNAAISALSSSQSGSFATIDSDIASHIARNDNPHSTTKAQVGLSNVPNYAIATQAEAETGTANDKLMTPLRVKEAVLFSATANISVHKARTDNPHSVTKAQVGLGNVADYAIASQAEAEAGVLTNRYMTPLRVKQAINVQVDFGLLSHTGNKNNPHSVTQAQVGLGSLSNYRVATQTEAEAGVASNLYMTPQRTKEAIQFQTKKALSEHATRTDNPHSVTKVQVGLSNIQNYPPATQAEALAGTANDRFMTPVRVKELFDSLADFSVDWASISGKPLTFTPSAHNHTWSEITNKPATFAPSSHSLDWSEITNVPTVFDPTAHTHTWSSITGKPTTFSPETHILAWNDITGKPATYSPSVHDHDWSEITTKPSEFEPAAHTHTSSDIIGLETITPVNVVGPSTVIAESVTAYAITNFDSYQTYTVTAVSGSVSQSGDTITYTAPVADTVGGFIINGRQIDIAVTLTSPNQPSVTSPTNGASNQDISLSITSSAFSVPVGSTITHVSSDWQLATDAGFTNIVAQVLDSAIYKTTWSASGLANSTTYYLRVRHKGSNGLYSAWSNGSYFITKAAIQALAGIEQNYITPFDLQWEGGLDKIAIDDTGTRVVVTATGETQSGFSTYWVFVRSGTSWSLEQSFTGITEGRVAIDGTGTRIAIGDGVYVRSGSVWTLESNILNLIPNKEAHYGLYDFAITKNGDRLFAGSTQSVDGAFQPWLGRIDVFVRSGSTWTLETTINQPNSVSNTGFGIEIAIDDTGTRLVTGHRDASDQGGAVVFVRSGITWTLEATLIASPVVFDAGASVDMDSTGTRIVIGAPHYQSVTSEPGPNPYVFIFARSGVTWTQEAAIAPNPYWKNFGSSVSINSDGSDILVGAPGKVFYSYTGDYGRVFAYGRSGTTWTERLELSSSINEGNNYGSRIAMTPDGSYAAVVATYSSWYVQDTMIPPEARGKIFILK